MNLISNNYIIYNFNMYKNHILTGVCILSYIAIMYYFGGGPTTSTEKVLSSDIITKQ
jgi:hypothetical protein